MLWYDTVTVRFPGSLSDRRTGCVGEKRKESELRCEEVHLWSG
jgi:hypothetical protein